MHNCGSPTDLDYYASQEVGFWGTPGFCRRRGRAARRRHPLPPITSKVPVVFCRQGTPPPRGRPLFAFICPAVGDSITNSAHCGAFAVMPLTLLTAGVPPRFPRRLAAPQRHSRFVAACPRLARACGSPCSPLSFIIRRILIIEYFITPRRAVSS
jgi:hypothetical protein